MEQLAHDILCYWFGNSEDDAEVLAEKGRIWFRRDDAFDADIKRTFGEHFDLAIAGAYDHWVGLPESRLALIILIDQFSRNIHRDSGAAYAHDAKALHLAQEGIALGHDQALRPIYRTFFYMPFQHSEDLAVQRESIELFHSLAASVPESLRENFEGFLDYAKRHMIVIEKFHRFPHRNPLLGRETTPEEAAFLQEMGPF